MSSFVIFKASASICAYQASRRAQAHEPVRLVWRPKRVLDGRM